MVIIVLLATEQHHWSGWELSASVKDNLYLLYLENEGLLFYHWLFFFSLVFPLWCVHGRAAEAVHQERHVHFWNTTSFSTALYSKLPSVCEARHPAECKITIRSLSPNHVWSGNCTSDCWECFKQLQLQAAWSNLFKLWRAWRNKALLIYRRLIRYKSKTVILFPRSVRNTHISHGALFTPG